MTTYFADTSALAKRYLIELGSKWVLNWIEAPAGNTIVVSELTIVEMRSVLARRMREGTLIPTNAAMLRTDFLAHVRAEYLIIYLQRNILNRAADLVDIRKLRALDAIQLACALHASQFLNQTITFVSADNNLLSAASAEGFLTDNPNNHP